MILLLDIGNSRIKWACLSAGVLQPQAAVEHEGRLPDALLAAWAEIPDVTSVRACCVGGERLLAEIASAVADRWHCQLRRLTPGAELAGVRNAYARPKTLGADRWAALLGARRLNLDPCCIVDAGTATTLDWLDGSGRHRGGLILPGLDLMRDSLNLRTAGIGWQTTGKRPAVFADNTADAVIGGALHGTAATVRWFLDAAREASGGECPRLVLSGGNAEALAIKLADLAPQQAPDLVLHGLALAAASADRAD